MRFSIRDLLWATVVVAMGLGWWLHDRAMDAKCREAISQTQRHRLVLQSIYEHHGDRLGYLQPGGGMVIVPKWSVLDEPLVEP